MVTEYIKPAEWRKLPRRKGPAKVRFPTTMVLPSTLDRFLSLLHEGETYSAAMDRLIGNYLSCHPVTKIEEAKP